MLKNASFNEDRTFRWSLSRIWNMKTAHLMFIGLNPSTADENETDNTITRLIHFAKSEGFGGFYIVNRFPLIASKPKDLKKWIVDSPEKEYIRAIRENRRIILQTWRWCGDVCFMWGANELKTNDIPWFKNRFPTAKCFGHTKNGHPMHPLYLPNETNLVDFFPKIRK